MATLFVATFPSFSCNLEGAFRCAGTDNCIDGKNVCNKQKDCPNGDDESRDCGKDCLPEELAVCQALVLLVYWLMMKTLCPSK